MKKWLFDVTLIRPDALDRGIPKVVQDWIEVILETAVLLESVEFIVEQEYRDHFLKKYSHKFHI